MLPNFHGNRWQDTYRGPGHLSIKGREVRSVVGGCCQHSYCSLVLVALLIRDRLELGVVRSAKHGHQLPGCANSQKEQRLSSIEGMNEATKIDYVLTHQDR